jgi:hypothetical protein
MALSNAVAEGKTLKRQHSGGLPSNEAENDTEESEGTSEIDQVVGGIGYRPFTSKRREGIFSVEHKCSPNPAINLIR